MKGAGMLVVLLMHQAITAAPSCNCNQGFAFLEGVEGGGEFFKYEILKNCST